MQNGQKDANSAGLTAAHNAPGRESLHYTGGAHCPNPSAMRARQISGSHLQRMMISAAEACVGGRLHLAIVALHSVFTFR